MMQNLSSSLSSALRISLNEPHHASCLPFAKLASQVAITDTLNDIRHP